MIVLLFSYLNKDVVLLVINHITGDYEVLTDVNICCPSIHNTQSPFVNDMLS